MVKQSLSKTDFQKAKAYLQNVDPILAVVTQRIPLEERQPNGKYFENLVESIISQQLSIKAADTIFARFVALFETNTFPEAAQILLMPDEKIRAAGLSYSKIAYIKDLSEKVSKGILDLEKVVLLSDEEVILHLTDIKGIGRWTAEMFLMFSLGRPDVFSYGDLGLRNAMRNLYHLKTHPSEKQAKKISDKWKPYRTLACRYLWKSLELV